MNTKEVYELCVKKNQTKRRCDLPIKTQKEMKNTPWPVYTTKAGYCYAVVN